MLTILFVQMVSVSGSMVQTFLDNILVQCLDVNVRLRNAAVNTIGIIIRQGLMHPLLVS